ncbi:unnamed protein product [Closterium sp. NIES-64]|nr:unnamed protein product [Closterium sp. NIES-64]
MVLRRDRKFCILAAVGGNLTAFSTGRFLLAAGIIAFIFSCSAASKVILPPSPSPLHTHSILVAADGNLTAFSTGRFLLAAGINGILAAADGNLTAFSTGQFLLAAGIIGFIFSFIALVAGIAAVASSSLRDKQSRMYLYFAAESFLNVCLLFGAACTGANVFGESCGFLSNAYDAFESRTNTCTYAKTSVGFAFLASFAFMATHWYYVFAMNRG